MIHRYWDGPPHPLHDWTANAIASTHGERPVDWTPRDAPQALSGDARHDSNVTRYHLLYEHGGLWLDHDVIPLEDLRRDRPYTAGIGNIRVGCVLNFPEPGHPMLAQLLAEIPSRSGTAPERSGGRLLNAVGRSYPDVAILDGVLPFDRDGQRRRGVPALAVHLWDSSYVASRQGAST